MSEIKSKTGIPPARILPVAAGELLRAAAREPPARRHFAIDAAIDEVKLKYPQFFKPEKE